MATLSWLGGGNNKASNPRDWNTDTVPHPGDALLVTTFNVRGNDLAGDPIMIGTGTGNGVILTANLTNHAIMTASMFNSVSTFNLSQNSALDLTVYTGSGAGVDLTTVNMKGTNTFVLTDHTSNATVNLAAGARWNGTFDMGTFFGVGFGNLTVNGDNRSTFNNNGHSVVNNTESVVLNTDVTGRGSFDVTNNGPGNFAFGNPLAKMEFVRSVGANQSITASGQVQIDEPNLFRASITLKTPPTSSFGVPSPLPAEIDLMGLATADSYTYKNDMLSIYSGKSAINRLHLSDQTLHGFVVEKGAGSVNIVAILDPAHAPVGLPIHV
jgi:hypothetical protein